MAFERLRAELILDASQWSSGISEAESGVTSLEDRTRSMGRSMQSAGKSMTKGVTAPLMAMGGLAVKTAADFDSSMTQSIAIMGDVSDTMRNDMEVAARDVAKTTTFSADEVADAYFYMASAGMDAGESIEAVGDFATFAQAGMFDLALATDILTDASSALGLEMHETALLGDQLVKANTLANASVEQFGTALTTKAAAAMREFGIETEDGIAALAVFADQGLKGRRAGTQLNRMIRDLASNARTNADAFDDLGVSVFDSSGNMRSLADIVKDVEAATEGMSTEQRNAALSTLGLNQQATDSLALLIGNSDALDEYTGELENAGGTAEEVADKQLESLHAQLSILRSNIADLAIQFGNELVPAIRLLINFLQRLTFRFGEMDSRTRRIIVVLAAVAAAIGPLLMALGTFLILAAPAIGMLSGLGAAKLALLGPIGLLVGAVIGLYAAWQRNIFGLRDVTAAVFDAIPGLFRRGMEAAQAVVDSVLEDIMGIHDAALDAIEAWWIEHGDAVTATVLGYTDEIRAIYEAAIDIIQGVIETALDIITGIWETHGDTVIETAQAAYDFAADTISAAFGIISEIAQRILSTVSSLWEEHEETVRGAVDSAYGFAETVVTTAFNTIRELANTVLDAVSGFWEEHQGTVREAVRESYETVRPLIVSALDAIRDHSSTVFGAVNSLWEEHEDEIRNVFRETYDVLEPAARSALGSLRDTTEEILGDMDVDWEAHGDTVRDAAIIGYGAAAEAIGGVMETLSEEVPEALDTVEELWDAHGEAIEGVVGTLVDDTIERYQITYETLGEIGEGAFEILNESWENHADIIEDAVQRITDAIDDLQEAYGGMEEANQRLAVTTITLGALMLKLVPPIGILIGAIGLLAIAWRENWFGIQEATEAAIAFITEDIMGFTTETDAELAGHGDSIRENITEAWQEAAAIVGGIFSFMLENHWRPFFEQLTELYHTHGEALVDEFLATIEHVMEQVAMILGLAALVWDMWSEEILAIVTFFLEAIQMLFINTLDMLLTIVRIGLAMIRGEWDVAGELLIQMIIRIHERILTWMFGWGERFVLWLIGWLQSVLDAFIEWGRQLIGGSIIPDIFNAIFDFIVEVMERIYQLFVTALESFLELWQTALEAIWEAILTAWEAITEFLMTTMETIWEIFTVAWEAITELLLTAHETIWEVLNTAWEVITEFLTTTMETIATMIDEAWTAISEFFMMILETIWEHFNTAWEAISDFLTEINEAIGEMIDTVWSTIEDFIETTMESIGNTFETVWDAIEGFLTDTNEAIGNMIDRVWSIIEGFIEDTMESIAQTFDTVWTAIEDFLETTNEAIGNMIDRVWSIIEDFLSGKMDDIKQMFDTTWTEIEDIIDTIIDSIHDVIDTAWNEIHDTVTGLMEDIAETIDRILGDILEAVTQKMGEVVEAFTQAMRDALSAISGFQSNFRSAGSSLMEAFAGGIRSAGEAAVRAARRLAQRARDALPGSDAKEGPLADLSDTGPAFVETFAQGIEANAGRLSQAAQNAVDDMPLDPEGNARISGATASGVNGGGMTREELKEAVANGIEDGMSEMVLETLIEADDETIERIIQQTTKTVIRRERNRFKRGTPE